MLDHIYEQDSFGETWFTYPNLYSKMVHEYPSGSHFVEVGSWKGKSSSYMGVMIANSNKDIKFDCVDTWLGSTEHTEIMKDLGNDLLYNTFINNMKPLEGYYSVVRMLSVDASKTYKNESLDFVFIDASHEYENIKEDIEAWFPKIKRGGYLAGDDYDNFWPGVKQAVDVSSLVQPFTVSVGCWIHLKN